MATDPRGVPALAEAASLAASGTRSSASPRYITLADILLQEIQDGKYPVGEKLPTEREISQRFGVSRHTTREAVRRLDEMGLITRRAGIGTLVKARLAQARYTAAISDLSQLVHYAQGTHLKVLEENWVTIEHELASVLPEAIGQRWLRIAALRYPEGGQMPISFTENLVPAAYESIREGLRRPHATIFKLIEQLRGEPVAELRQDISCRAIPRHIAARLEVPAGTPALYVLRYYYGRHDVLLSLSINYYPQDRFVMSTRWQLDWEE